MKQKSVLISCEPYTYEGVHQIRDNLFVFIVSFENGVTGYKRSTSATNPYIIGQEYEFISENKGGNNVITGMSLPDKIKLSYDYMQMLQNSIAFAVHTMESPSMEDIDDINRKFLALKDDYVRNSTE